MAANTSPIYTLTPNIGTATWSSSTTANTKNDGSGTVGTDILLAFTAGANGSFIQKIRATLGGSVASTASTATVLRAYLSTVNSGSTTNANTFRLDEVACPQQTSDQPTVGTFAVEIPLGIAVPTNRYILVSMHHAAAANTVWQIEVIGGDY